MCDRFQLPGHVGSRTPSSEDFISLSGERGLLFQDLTTAEDTPPHNKTSQLFIVVSARHHNFLLSSQHQQMIVAFDQGQQPRMISQDV